MYDDLLRVPEPLVAEIVSGELYTSPRPSSRHARAASSLGGCLVPPFDHGERGPGGWWIVDEPELHLGENVLVPDLAGWRRERMPEFPDSPAFTLTPDWICEVVSPSTGMLDRTRKLPAYATHGIPHAWLVDPALKTLEVFELGSRGWLLLATHRGGDIVAAVPFDAVGIHLAKLWV